MKYSKEIILGVACIASLTTINVNAQEIEKNDKIGKNLYELVYNSKDNGVYVASITDFKSKEGAIYKLNGDDLTVEKVIKLQGNPIFGLAINETTQKLYGGNTITNSVTVVDLKTEETKIINGSKENGHNREIAIDEKNNVIYASDTQKVGKIWVIDGNTDKLTGYIDNTGLFTTGLAFDSKTNKLYATNLGGNEIIIIDPISKKIVKKFPCGGINPLNIAIDEEGRRLFIANGLVGLDENRNKKFAISGDPIGLTVLNADTGELIKLIKFEGGSLGIKYDSKQNKIIIANRESGKTAVVDGKTLEVIKELETGSYPNTVAVNSALGVVYVTNKAKYIEQVEGEEEKIDPNGDLVTKIKL